MSRTTALIAVAFTAAIGIALGVLIANWRFGGARFVDPEVLLAARILIGGAGAFLFGYVAQSLMLKKRVDV